MLDELLGAQEQAEALVADQRYMEREIFGLQNGIRSTVLAGREALNECFDGVPTPAIFYVDGSDLEYSLDRVGKQALLTRSIGEDDAVLFFATRDEFLVMEARQSAMFPAGNFYPAAKNDYESLTRDWDELSAQARGITGQDGEHLKVKETPWATEREL